MGDLDFNETIGYYEEVFGREGVEIFLLSTCGGIRPVCRENGGLPRDRPGSFLEPSGAGALQSDDHTAPADFGRFITAYLPRFLTSRSDRLVPTRLKRRFKRFLGRGPSAKPPPSEALDEWIASHRQSGNRALNAGYGNQLTRHRYTL
jgi:hypothetical protein